MRSLLIPLAIFSFALLAACTGGSSASGPAQAVATPVQALVDNDLAGFMRSVAPADEYAMIQEEWQRDAGIDAEDLDKQLGVLLSDGGVDTLMPMVEMTLTEVEPEQLASQIEMVGGMMLMGVTDDPESAQQLQATVKGLADKVRTSGINDPEKARKALESLVSGLQSAGISKASDVVDLPFEEAMAKVKPVVAAVKQGLQNYDLDLDSILNGLSYSAEGEGDDQRVNVQGSLFGNQFTIPVPVHQVDGAWKINPNQ